MSKYDAVIYLGAEPAKNQIVSDELKARGINLLRKPPSAFSVSGGPTTVQPNYSIYKHNLPHFMKSAMTGRSIYYKDDNFVGFDHGNLPILPFSFPKLVVNWTTPVGEEVTDQMKTYGFRHTMIKGKAAMVKEKPTVDDAKKCLEKKCNTTTPAGEECTNIQSLKRLLLIARIAAMFLRTHQYPAFIDEDHESEFNKEFTVNGVGVKEKKGEGDDDDEMLDLDGDENQFRIKRFFLNLPTPVEDMPIQYDEESYPKGASGLCIQYISELCEFDRYTVPNVIRLYFYHLLGESEEEADEVFQAIISAWGVSFNSEWGNIYSHIFFCIDLAIRMQAQLCVMSTAGAYDGCVLRGAGYRFRLGNKFYEPVPAATLEPLIKTMDYHAEALWGILNKLDMMDDAKLAAFKTCRTMWKLKEYIDSHRLNGGTEVQSAINSLAKRLSFPDHRTLEYTAANIDLALSCISDPSKDLVATLPSIHHSQLFTTERKYLVWSAFGDSAPSFRVPGGKVMLLSERFSVTSAKIRKELGPGGRREVGKIGAVIVPLHLALQHLDLTLSEKTVMNPFGNAVVNAAQSHMNKVYEGESCSMIINALRKVCSVTVEDQGQGGKKRKEREDDLALGSRKKRADDWD